MLRINGSIVRLSLVLSCSSLPCAAGVIVVDAAGGGGATDLPQAVASAVDGDVLLVKPGHYSGFTIDALSLRVVADGGTVRVFGSVQVINLSAGQRVAFDEIDIRPPFLDIFSNPPALLIANCAGSVRLERCDIEAPSAFANDFCEGSGIFWPAGADAVSVSNCAEVVIGTGKLVGGRGIGSTDALCFDRGSPGGRGLRVHDARVNLHDVIVRGADGMLDGNGGDGGHGMQLTGTSDVLASGVLGQGGDGGGSTDFIGLDGLTGNGGDGVNAAAGTLLRVLSGLYTGGTAGLACCWTNDPGLPMVVAGALVDYAGNPHRLLTSSPAREGETLEVSITGAPGDQAWMWLGVAPILFHLPSFSGALYLDPTQLIGPFALGTLTTNLASVPFPVPELVPGLDALQLDAQVLVLEAAGGVSVLSGPGQVVLLDGAW